MVRLYLLGLHFTVYSLEEPVVDQQLPLNVQFRRGFFRVQSQFGRLTRPGKDTKSYWKWWFIVDLPMKTGDFP